MLKTNQPPNTVCATPQVVKDGDFTWHVIVDAMVGPKRQLIRWTQIAECPSKSTAHWIRDAADERLKKGLPL